MVVYRPETVDVVIAAQHPWCSQRLEAYIDLLDKDQRTEPYICDLHIVPFQIEDLDDFYASFIYGTLDNVEGIRAHLDRIVFTYTGSEVTSTFVHPPDKVMMFPSSVMGNYLEGFYNRLYLRVLDQLQEFKDFGRLS